MEIYLFQGLIKADFVAEIKTETGKPALCWGLWATLVNADLVDSLCEVVDDILSDPIGFVSNPFATLGKPLVGIIGDKPVTKPYADPEPCIEP